jgi:ATP/maltotriose-dependent transcriptional regulator MalT
LHDEGAEPERVALHLLATDPAADATVVETLFAAAQRALDRAAPEAAIAYLRRALAEPPEATKRLEVLALHAMAGFRAGDPRLPEAPPDEVIAELSADTGLLLRAAPYLVDGLFALGRGEEATAFLKRAVELAVATGDHHLALRLDAQRIILEQLVPAAARAQFERYRDLIEPGTPGERLWLALHAWWSSQLGDTTAAEVGHMAARAWEGGRIVLEDSDGMASASSILALLRADELDLVARALDHFESASQRTRATPAVAGHAYLTACLAHDTGDLVTAQADARRAVEAARGGGFLLAFPIWIALLVDVLIERGELDAAEQEIEASGMTGDIPESFWFGPLLHSRGCLRLAQGRIDEALADLADVTRRGERDGIVRPTPHAAPPTATIALASAGETDAARESAATRLTRARAWGTPRTIGTALRCAGIVEGGERGIELLHEAVATLADSPARLEHARALVDLGAALRRTNRRADAREPLREGLALARRCGATVLAQRAHEELAATGEKMRPLVAIGADSLTPSERRIAGMAAEGMTNRAIAQALFLTVKTVETHLSNAYRKLDIRSRSELPCVLEPDA